MRLGGAGAGVCGLLRRIEGHGLNGLALFVALGSVREHGFDAALPSVLQFGQIQRLTGCHELVASVVSPTSLTSTRLDTAGTFAVSASSMMKEP